MRSAARCAQHGPLLWLLVCAACTGGDRAPGVAVTDSAGVTIVQSGRQTLASATELTLADQPALEIATDEAADVVLYQVGAVSLLPGGRLAVANGGSKEVFVFGPDGTLTLRFGGEGDGPGEFQSITSVFAVGGDSIAVYDSDHQRLSVFDAGGGLGREVSFGTAVENMGFATVLPLSTGDLVLFTIRGGFGAPRQGPYRLESESVRLSSEGTVHASYGTFPGTEIFVGNRMAGMATFGASTVIATSGDRLVVGTEEAPELAFYAPTGHLAKLVRWPDHDREVTQARLDSVFDATLAAIPADQRALLQRVFEQVPHAERMPPYEELVAAEDGGVWVGSYVPKALPVPGTRTPARNWLVFDAEGGLVSTVTTPEGFQPKAVRDGSVVGVFTDDLGIESVRVYPVEGARPVTNGG